MNNSLKKNGVTIDEIALAAGVSKTTVSRYINGKFEFMSGETRERLRKIIEENDYRPSNIARSMKLTTTKTIGCVVVDISNPITSIICKGILAAAQEHGYRVLFSSTGGVAEQEKEAIDSFLLSRVDGVLVNTTCENMDYLLRLQENGTKIVLIDRVPQGEERFDCVRSQNETATEECIRHLHDQGYKSVALFHSGLSGNENLVLRHRAYNRVIEELYGTTTEDLIFEVEDVDFKAIYNADSFRFSKSIESVNKFLSMPSDGPKGIFAISATTALGALWALQRMGVDNFPEIGFCSFNDWGTASIVKNGITTITQDAYAIGFKAASVLFERIDSNEDYEPEICEMPTRLIVRNSTKLKKEAD